MYHAVLQLAMARTTGETYRRFHVEPPDVAEPRGDPVGTQEIAERLGLESRSVHMIRHRGQLPAPDYTVNGLRAWEWRKILWWAGETDRLRTPRLLSEYESVFGHRPRPHNSRRAARGVQYPPLPGLDVAT